MKRAYMTMAVTGGLLLTTATPAAATTPSRFTMSGHYSYLSSYSDECTPEVEGRKVCTYVSLWASERPDGPDYLSMYLSEYVLDNGEHVSSSYAYGWREGDLPFTVTKDVTATLAPTTVTLESYDDEGGYQYREATVSASDTAAGAVSTVRRQERFTDGSCTYTNRVRESSAQVEGTITLDGLTYADQGWAATGDVRSSRRCR